MAKTPRRHGHIPVEAAADLLEVRGPTYAGWSDRGVRCRGPYGCSELDVVRAAIYQRLTAKLGQDPGWAAYEAVAQYIEGSGVDHAGVGHIPTLDQSLFVLYTPHTAQTAVVDDARRLGELLNECESGQVVALPGLIHATRANFRRRLEMRQRAAEISSRRPTGAYEPASSR